jgi:hypothetical protein
MKTAAFKEQILNSPFLGGGAGSELAFFGLLSPLGDFHGVGSRFVCVCMYVCMYV